MKFVKYMHLLYACLSDQAATNIPGHYTKIDPVGFASTEGKGDSSALEAGVGAFKALEADFDRCALPAEDRF
eukprot:788764-Rhodomonas_salina.6